MEMQLIRESIEMEQPLGTGRSRAVVEGEVTLPGGLREETRVLSAGAMAVIEGSEAQQDRVSVSGRVVFHVLYTQGDPKKINVIEASADFTHPCGLPGSQPRAQAETAAQVEVVEARVNGGRMTMRAEIGLGCRVLLAAPVEAIMGVNGSDDVEIRTSEAALCRTVARGSGETLLREEFALPASLEITETLYATAVPVSCEATGGMGRAGLSGEIALEAVHASCLPGRPLVVTRHTIPVNQSVELAGEDGDMLVGRITIRDVAVASQDAGGGERTLRAEVLVGLESWAERREEISLMADAYTTQGDDLSLTTGKVNCRTGSLRWQGAESARATLLLPDSAPPVRTVLIALAVPAGFTLTPQSGRTQAEGMLRVTMLYMTDDDAPVSVHQEVPFRAVFPVQIPGDALTTLTASEVAVTPITSDRVELRCIMHLRTDGALSDGVQLVTDARSVTAEKPTEDIVLYFTQPGETLWDVARRYRLPVQGIRRLNPELTGEPRVGQGVVIWRRGGA